MLSKLWQHFQALNKVSVSKNLHGIFKNIFVYLETNRKILEDLQLKKQQLSKTSNILGTSIISSPQLHIPNLQPISLSENSSRTAYNLTTQAIGFFIVQDSLCGNTILPVIPRFENTTPVPQATTAKPK